MLSQKYTQQVFGLCVREPEGAELQQPELSPALLGLQAEMGQDSNT